MQVFTKIFIVFIFRRTIDFMKYPYLLYDMVKKKAGRPESEDKREPFNLRLKGSLLKELRKRSNSEKRAMNTVAEMILEKELLEG